MSDLPDGFGPDDPTARHQTEHGYSVCDFKSTEHPPRGEETDSTPWIMINVDLRALGISGTEGGFLGLELRAGVSQEDSDRLARELDRMIVGVSCTKFVA